MWVTDRDVAHDSVSHECEEAISGVIDAGLGKTQRCAPFALFGPRAFDDADNCARRPLRMAVEHRRARIKARKIDGITRDHEDFLVVDGGIEAGPAAAARGRAGGPDDFDGSGHGLGPDGNDHIRFRLWKESLRDDRGPNG